ncbi:sulfite exporter TauE/SafE family protein [Celerinatantimonas diazotrophica]|uniref:Probable membrane transporter protein n=1 Tax=Celerinatantimonas diazotrophica TaxID=412034 RepID=A0A4R1K224_9GAMM|nr:sulfite exporter TauE/SafE family protein [Celerinatantimonas diazotrophica]TCK58068.1 putative membrane protein YfcA [Celerinatantimonas diazotrophica]CAG9297863.1 hypothetical protein CEDIAZO_03055 [Celerinatantimonas diazotrophica]
MMSIILFVFSGFCCGILSRLYGLGGGLVINPTLLYILPLVGIPNDDVYQITISTTLTIMLVNSAINGRQSLKKENVPNDVILHPILYILLGCLLGCIFIIYINKNIGMIFFVIFVTIINLSNYMKSSKFPRVKSLAIRSVICGVISSWVGGGSSLMMYSYLQREKSFSSRLSSIICNRYNVVIAIFCISVYHLLSGNIVIQHVFFNVYIDAVIYILMGSIMGSYFATWLESKPFMLYKNTFYKLILMVINIAVIYKLATLY